MATFTVTNTNDSGAGSLRQAITSADASTGKNIINFSGLFDDGLAHTISLTGGGLSITDDTTIQGTNPNLLTISEDSASRVFDVTSNATATINGLTITNSYNGALGGGGISNEGVLTLNNSIITGNTVTNNDFFNYDNVAEGGGIYNTGSLTVNNSNISNNSISPTVVSVGRGAGIYNEAGSLTVNNSTISNNSISSKNTFLVAGGGIYSLFGDITVNNSNISGNTAPGEDNTGGGISGSIVTVTNSTINDNTAGYGGGISGSTVTVTNSTISGNTASEYYGGIEGDLTLTNSTISGNSASNGGGIGAGTVTNSVIIDNTANYGGGIFFDSNAAVALIVTNSIISGNSAYKGGGIFNTDFYTVGGEGGLSVSNSAIINNYASGYGGGIYNSSSITVSYSSISDNTAGIAGGGIYNDDVSSSIPFSIVTVSESTIAGNQAHFGAGIYNASTLTVENSAIEYNKAFGIELSSGVYQSGDGGGIYNNSTYGTTTLYSNAIAYNFDTCQEYSNNPISFDDIAGNFINNGYNWIGINTATTAAGDAA